VINAHPAVFESAAIAYQPGGEGAEKLVVYAILGEGGDLEELRRDLGRTIAQHLNPLFKIFDLVVVDSIPRTASNKLMRRKLRWDYAQSKAEGKGR
jgi:acetyl-CoA synthetase